MVIGAGVQAGLITAGVTKDGLLSLVRLLSGTVDLPHTFIFPFLPAP